MAKNIFKITAVFIVGIVGGIFGFQFILQYQLNGAPVVVNQIKEIIIQENSALENSIEKVEKAIVGVMAETEDGKTLTGSGLIVTSDGLVVALSDNLPRKGSFIFFVDGQVPDWQILKRDDKSNLVLIKLEANDLKTVAFADFNNIKLGQRVFSIGTFFNTKPLSSVNEGIIRFFVPGRIETNIIEKKTLSGSVLFNIQGELLGINTIDSEGRVSSISVDKIKEFLGY